MTPQFIVTEPQRVYEKRQGSRKQAVTRLGW